MAIFLNATYYTQNQAGPEFSKPHQEENFCTGELSADIPASSLEWGRTLAQELKMQFQHHVCPEILQGL